MEAQTQSTPARKKKGDVMNINANGESLDALFEVKMAGDKPKPTPGRVDFSALLRQADAEADLDEAKDQVGQFSIIHDADARREELRVQRSTRFTPQSAGDKYSPLTRKATSTPGSSLNPRGPPIGSKKMTMGGLSDLAKAAQVEAEAEKMMENFQAPAPPQEGSVDGDDGGPRFGLLRNHERAIRKVPDPDDGSETSELLYYNMYGEQIGENDYNAFDLDAQEEWATSWLALKYIKLARTCLYVAEADWFDTYMLSCIALAGIIIGLETYEEFQGDSTLGALDTFVLCSFAFEVLVRTIGEGFTPWRFFTNAQWRWNCFDFCIVFFSIPILPFAAKNVKLLRVVRLLRLTHVFKRIPQLNMIMRGLVDSLSFVSYIVLLWFMILYIYAILGEELFGKNDPWHFRSIEFALVALLQVTCMDGWGQIFDVNYYGCEEYNGGFYTMDPALGSNEVGGLMLCENPQPQPVASILFFISYVTMTAFCIIPLFIGAVSISMTDCVADMEQEKKLEDRRLCLERLQNVDESMHQPEWMTRKKKRAMELVGMAFKGEPIAEPNVCRDSSVRYRLHAKYRELGAYCAFFIERPRVQRLITLAIITGGVVVGLQTDRHLDKEYHGILVLMNNLILYIFTAEVVLKMVAEVEYPYMYFGDNWNCFDFVVVAGSYMPEAGSSVIILRLMRLMRVLKLMRQFQNLQVIIEGATDGLSAACYISAIIGIIYYFFAILGNVLFAENDPASWGEVHIAMIILFQIATQDNFTPYFYTIIFGCENQPSPLMFDEEADCTHSSPSFLMGSLYFTVFTIFGSYVLLALFVGSIGSAMDAAHDRQKALNRVKRRVKILKDALGLTTAEIEGYREAFDFIDVSQTGRIGDEELKFGLQFAGQEMSTEQFNECWTKMDRDGTQDIDFSEFLIFMLDVRALAIEKANFNDPSQVLKLSGFSDYMDETGKPGPIKPTKGDVVLNMAKNVGVAISDAVGRVLPQQPVEQEFELLGPEDEEKVDDEVRRLTSAYQNILLDEGDIELAAFGDPAIAEELSGMRVIITEAVDELLTEKVLSPSRFQSKQTDTPMSQTPSLSTTPRPAPLSPSFSDRELVQLGNHPLPLKLELFEPSATGASRSLLLSPARLCVRQVSVRVGGEDKLLAAVAVVKRAWLAYRGRQEYLKVSKQMDRLAVLLPTDQKMRSRESLYRPYTGIYLPDDPEVAERVRGGIDRVVEFYNPEEEILFIDCHGGQIMSKIESKEDEVAGSPQTRPTWSVEERIFVLTDRALYLLSYAPSDYHTIDQYPKTLPFLLLQRRVELESSTGLQRVNVSHLADCALGLAVAPNAKLSEETAEKLSRAGFEDSTTVSHCPITSKEFGFANPRRHCRVSGLVFHNRACNYRQPLPDDGFQIDCRIGDPFIGLKSIQQKEDLLIVSKRKSELLVLLAERSQALNGKEMIIIIGNRLKMRPGVYERLVRVPAKEVSFMGGYTPETTAFGTRRGSFVVRNEVEARKMTTYSSTFGLNLVCNAMSDSLRVYSENGLECAQVRRLDDLREKGHRELLQNLRRMDQTVTRQIKFAFKAEVDQGPTNGSEADGTAAGTNRAPKASQTRHFFPILDEPNEDPPVDPDSGFDVLDVVPGIADLSDVVLED